uniref:Uncharacterized protein n=1 Tax=Oryza brachyantha TaxID=4533 RepID=J3KVI5_ORYBR
RSFNPPRPLHPKPRRAGDRAKRHGPESERVPDRVRRRRRDAAGVRADTGVQHPVHRRRLHRPPLRALRQGRLHLALIDSACERLEFALRSPSLQLFRFCAS